MPMFQEFWKKLNANERLVAYGIVVVLVAFVLGLVSPFGIGNGSFIGAAIVAVLYWNKYAPTPMFKLPWPTATAVLVVAGVEALWAIVGLVGWLGVLSFYGGVYLIAAIGNAVGAALMAYGAWREYQAMPKSSPPSA